MRVSSPGLSRAYSRTYALGVTRRHRARRRRPGQILRRCLASTLLEKIFVVLLRGDVSVLLAAGECLFVVPEIFVVLAVY